MNTQGRDLTALQSFSERSDAPDKPKPMCGPPSCILEHKPGRREVVHKTRTTPPRIAVSYGVLRPQTRNGTCLAGLE